MGTATLRALSPKVCRSVYRLVTRHTVIGEERQGHVVEQEDFIEDTGLKLVKE